MIMQIFEACRNRFVYSSLLCRFDTDRNLRTIHNAIVAVPLLLCAVCRLVEPSAIIIMDLMDDKGKCGTHIHICNQLKQIAWKICSVLWNSINFLFVSALIELSLSVRSRANFWSKKYIETKIVYNYAIMGMSSSSDLIERLRWAKKNGIK